MVEVFQVEIQQLRLTLVIKGLLKRAFIMVLHHCFVALEVVEGVFEEFLARFDCLLPGDPLAELLVLSDLVKFAKEKPSQEENEKVMADAYHFIGTTKQMVS